MIRIMFCLLTFALCLPAPAMAWGGKGHRLIARLAEAQLTPQALAEIHLLLAGEPDPSLAAIASWADELRKSDPGLGKQSAPWHYIDIGEHDCHYDGQRDCPDGNCLVEAIRRQTAILADTRKSKDDRLQALKFVVHFVGDVHQPLHAGYARDRGGNDFQVNFNGKGSNLHRLWDSQMLASTGLDEDAYLRRLQSIALEVETPDPVLPPHAQQWAEHACRVVLQPGFYPPRAKLGEDYVLSWLPIAETSLVTAGAHLAQVLNAAFPEGKPA